MKRYLAIGIRRADVDPELIEGHKRYLQSLLQSGRLLLSGPFAEGPGGAYLFQAADAAAAAAVVADDPLQSDSRVEIPLREWVIRLDASEVKA